MKKDRLLIFANIYIYIYFLRIVWKSNTISKLVFHESYSVGELVRCYDTEPPSCHYLSR